ncbi:hypothetical protein [Flammeovirga pacifica]|uniref:hypothetical protein n=1 Tax=Flammeovirga pacifica TaxID=915059 RepID=UPI0013018250|nr:hypothetical protein [Flammeovirga pacifica]
MITLKPCNNSGFEKYYQWYQALAADLIKEPQEKWRKDYRPFHELHLTFLSI